MKAVRTSLSFVVGVVLVQPTVNAQLLDPIPGAIPLSNVSVGLVTVASGLTAPLFGMPIPGHPNRIYILDQVGIVWNLDLLAGIRTVFHDVSGLIVPLGVFGPGSFDERGLLGTAFHPNYQINGLVYTYTSQPLSGAADYSTMPTGVLADHQSVITEWHVNTPSDPNATIDPSSARELLRVDEPQFNHNAGALAFGPDGMLYIALGDGGGADDRDGQDFIGVPIIGHGLTGNGQDTSNPLGAILRIDPSGSNSPNGSYGIPSDNPFIGNVLFLDEIYAYGFRNPFRMSFDTVMGDLLVGDVGQNDIEEVDIVVSGGNYGWNVREGSFVFNHDNNNPGFVTDVPPGPPSSFIDPIAQYDHDEGIAIIGGFTYRGSAISGLQGEYICGDWARNFLSNDGRLFSVSGGGVLAELQLDGRTTVGLAVHGFAQDADGEVYLIGNETGVPSGTTGVVLKLSPPAVFADLNGDGIVDGADLGLLLGDWSIGGIGGGSIGDLNLDGITDGADLGLLLGAWTI